MTVNRQYRYLNPMGSTPREISEVVNNLVNGKSNNTGTITLNDSGATSTIIYDERIGYDSVILLEPEVAISATNDFPYGAFSDSTDQTISSTTAEYAFTFNTTDYSDGISITSNSRITAGYSGLYNVQFSVQFDNSDTQIHDASIWFKKNGINIANSNSQFSIPETHGGVNGKLVASLNLFVPLQKNEYVEIFWAATNTAVSVQHVGTQTSPTRPATPSIIATASYISSNGYTADVFTQPYVSSQTKGQATISHPANNFSTKSYKYLIVG